MRKKRSVAISAPARITLWQFLIGLTGSLLWLILGGAREGLAAFVGGCIGAILSLYVTIRVGSSSGDPRVIVGVFFRALAMKLLLAAVLFSAAAIFFADVYIPLITTFMAGLAAYWIALLRIQDL
ncbi:MAG: ATP synthase subunit I [Candidatus Competibacterales bacterium]|nr:ATP synthase subunit I [Candidatus Competibacterales bacterium]